LLLADAELAALLARPAPPLLAEGELALLESYRWWMEPELRR
jgi:hypothetical protein